MPGSIWVLIVSLLDFFLWKQSQGTRVLLAEIPQAALVPHLQPTIAVLVCCVAVFLCMQKSHGLSPQMNEAKSEKKIDRLPTLLVSGFSFHF